jgi:hypothetical protein
VHHPDNTAIVQGGLTTLATLTLPAGSYVVTGNADVENAANSGTEVIGCSASSIAGAAQTELRDWVDTLAPIGTDHYPAPGSIATLSFTGAALFASGGQIVLRCSTSSANAIAKDVSIVATMVGTVTTQ